TSRDKALGYKPQHCEEMSFSCILCGKTYCYRPCLCLECGKCFQDRSEVKCHLKVHQNRKLVASNQEHTVKAPLTTLDSKLPYSGIFTSEISPTSTSVAESSHSSLVIGSLQNTHRKQNIYCRPICDMCFRGTESLRITCA
ncbi:hypothetical protein A6R68_13624, partial [Neotoma lepida]